MANYVKFMRGSKSAYDTLINKDNDTLYFITDAITKTDPTTGETVTENKVSLYLGETTISNSVNSLSPAAQKFLDDLTTDELELNDGDLQVYTIETVENEVVNPETGETEIETTTVGKWETKSIDDLISVFNETAPGLVPQAPATNRDGKYLNGAGEWIDLNETVIQEAISQILGEGSLDERFDTLKEIAEWILNDTTNAAALNSRIAALEEATGVGKTETVEQTVYEQLVQENGDDEPLPLYWSGLGEEDKGIIVTDYPVYVPNQDGNEPPFVQETDNNNNPLYWQGVDENTSTTNVPNDTPAFGATVQEIEIPIENDVEKLQTQVSQQENSLINLNTNVGDLNILLGYSNKQNGSGKTLTVVDNLDSRVSTIESLLSNEGGEISLIVPEVGNLEELLLKQQATATDEGDPDSLVEAINILDNRTRWVELS